MKERLSHFCIHVKDMNASLDFYKNIMGFTAEYQTDDWSELKLNERVNLALYRVSEPGAGIGFVVDNCEVATTELEAKGVEIVMRCEKREADKIILTKFRDAEGNLLWITEKMK